MIHPMQQYLNPGGYVKWWRTAKDITKRGGTVRIFRTGNDLDAEALSREMRLALDKRINLRGGLVEKGRKFDPTWQMGCHRDARQINDYFGRRILVRLCNLSTLELRKRYKGRIPADYSED